MPSNRAPVVIAVFGADHVVGRALELLLRGAGYSARFVPETSIDDEQPRPLDGVRLLLFTAGLRIEQRQAYATFVENTPDASGVPILELVFSSDGAQARTGNFIPWPCRLEELKRRIEAALLGGSRSEERRGTKA